VVSFSKYSVVDFALHIFVLYIFTFVLSLSDLHYFLHTGEATAVFDRRAPSVRVPPQEHFVQLSGSVEGKKKLCAGGYCGERGLHPGQRCGKRVSGGRQAAFSGSEGRNVVIWNVLFSPILTCSVKIFMLHTMKTCFVFFNCVPFCAFFHQFVALLQMVLLWPLWKLADALVWAQVR